MKKIYILILISVFVTISCETSNTPLAVDSEGKLFITSNIDSAEIIIDEQFTGKYTPDTISAMATGYNIKLRKEKYFSEEERVIFKGGELLTLHLELRENNLERNILLEIFSNVGCNECVIVDSTLNLALNNFSNTRSLIINYPSKFPEISDPFYSENPIDFDNRLNFYDPILSNSAYLNGKNLFLPTEINSIKDIINIELSKETKFTMTVFDSVDSGPGYVASIFIDVFDTDQISFASLSLIILVIENELEYDSPPGSNGKTSFNAIVRTFLTDYSGRSLSNIGKRGRHKFFETKTLNPLWVLENLEVVAIIQNIVTKEILQVGSTYR